MIKKTLSLILVIFMVLGITACDGKIGTKKLPEYPQQEFGIAGYWAPYDIGEESLKTYKDAGFNTLMLINHSLDRTSEEQFYLGSKRTMTALENSKKVGLNVILNYNDWVAQQVEGEGYNGETPFSKYDLYGEYKDIITGVHIVDEPKYEHFSIYGNDTLINDFKKVYPNADYMVNLIPIYGAVSYGFKSFEDMLDEYDKTFMSNFETPYISVDIYPFHTKVDDIFSYLIPNHNAIAQKAKECGAKKTFILQASTGVEFEEELSEGDIRYQVHLALAFGADNLQYYCYSVPKGREYNCCILNSDNTPSDLYYYVQKINNEIQSYANAFLAYDWDKAIGVSGSEDLTFNMGVIEYDDNFERAKFENPKHYVSAAGTQDLIISRFTSEEYGEAYMLMNFAERNNTNTVNAVFKDCGAVAIYGGKDYSGTPEIVTLDENGNITIDLAYGEGVFVVPMV